MATVETTRETSVRRARRVEASPTTSTRWTGHRTASEAARLGHEAFGQLAPFFARRVDFARALGISPPALRQWLHAPPARPRQDTIRRVSQLRDVAVAAAAWVTDPHQVGEWLLAPHAELRGAVPAELAQTLPSEGVALLVDDMALIAPRERATAGEVTMSVDRLRQTLSTLRAPAIAPAEPVDAVDLSDFD